MNNAHTAPALALPYIGVNYQNTGMKLPHCRVIEDIASIDLILIQ